MADDAPKLPPVIAPAPPPSEADYIRHIASDLHFRVRQLRTSGVDPLLARGLMKAAFERFLVDDEPEVQRATADAHAWEIHIGEREIALHYGDPLLGIVHAKTRVEAEQAAWRSTAIINKMQSLGIPLGSGFWAVEVKR